MGIYSYEEAFGSADLTTRAMRSAIAQWNRLYYGEGSQSAGDTCQRVAYTVVSKLVRTVFGEYQTGAKDPTVRALLSAIDRKARQAVELSLVGGECYIKPCPTADGFTFTLIPRSNALIFGRDGAGRITDIGTVELSKQGKYYYTLLERRTVDQGGWLTIENRLYRSLNGQNIGAQVPLTDCSQYADLLPVYRYEKPMGSVGLVQVRTPMLNCVDGSADGVSVYAAAAGLIENIDENEQQLRQEFIRGQSRIIASRDLLREDEQGILGLSDHLFVGLDDAPEQVGITIFSPQLRQQSYLERKQEYLRNVESVIGLKRGMLSDANMEDRTATEISASAGEYNLTVIDFQRMWEAALRELMWLCGILAVMYRLPQGGALDGSQVTVSWGNGILYDQETTFDELQRLVTAGLLQPERLVGWYHGIPCDTQAERDRIRRDYMPSL